MTDPRRADEELHRAAEVLRRTAQEVARGTWRWAEPDPEVGVAERFDRPTSLKIMTAFPRAFARDDIDDAVRTPGPPSAEHGTRGAGPVDPVVAAPLGAAAGGRDHRPHGRDGARLTGRAAGVVVSGPLAVAEGAERPSPEGGVGATLATGRRAEARREPSGRSHHG